MFEITKTFSGTWYRVQSGEEKKVQFSTVWSLALCIASCSGIIWAGIGSLGILILLGVAQTRTHQSFWDKHRATMIFFFLHLPSYGCIQADKVQEDLAPLRRQQPHWVLAIRVYFCRVLHVGLVLATFRMCPWIICSSWSCESPNTRGSRGGMVLSVPMLGDICLFQCSLGI